jgi:hypothetical protein
LERQVSASNGLIGSRIRWSQRSQRGIKAAEREATVRHVDGDSLIVEGDDGSLTKIPVFPGKIDHMSDYDMSVVREATDAVDEIPSSIANEAQAKAIDACRNELEMAMGFPSGARFAPPLTWANLISRVRDFSKKVAAGASDMRPRDAIGAVADPTVPAAKYSQLVFDQDRERQRMAECLGAPLDSTWNHLAAVASALGRGTSAITENAVSSERASTMAQDLIKVRGQLDNATVRWRRIDNQLYEARAILGTASTETLSQAASRHVKAMKELESDLADADMRALKSADLLKKAAELLETKP